MSGDICSAAAIENRSSGGGAAKQPASPNCRVGLSILFIVTAQVSGFNLRKWLSGGSSGGGATGNNVGIGAAGAAASQSASRTKMLSILEALGKLVRANLLSVNFTE